jgi:hypothetical protein
LNWCLRGSPAYAFTVLAGRDSANTRAVVGDVGRGLDDRELAVEFKESFNKAGIPEYGRTMAGFANGQ